MKRLVRLYNAAFKYIQNGIISTIMPWIACFLLFYSPGGLFSQEVTIRMKTDTSAILIGDQIGLSLEAEGQKNYTIRFPVLADTLSSHIRIVKRIQADTLQMADRFRIVHRYLVTSFDSGMFEIPALPFIISHDGRNDTLYSRQDFLAVYFPPTDTLKDIFDIKPPLPAPYILLDYLRIIVPVLLVVAILVAIIYYLRRRKRNKKRGEVFRKPLEPAHVIALRELDRLKEEKLWQQGLVKEYYTRLTEIVRRYIEHRFEVPAMEQTSTEILQSMKPFALDDDTLNALAQLLTLADMVKFARELPMPDENESNMLNAYVFINHTRQEPAPVVNKEVLEIGGQ